jgi:hypothetical protein
MRCSYCHEWNRDWLDVASQRLVKPLMSSHGPFAKGILCFQNQPVCALANFVPE